jgi:hypothetical protein
MQSIRSVVVFIVILIVASGCKIAPVKREIKRVNEIQSVSPSNKFVKAHMKDGKVYILYNWHFDSGNNIIDGHGVYLDVNRNLIEERGKSVQNKNPFHVSLTDVALIETNDPGRSVAGPLAVVTGIVGAVSVFCLVNPKACFGSCPTFYASDGDSLQLQAEGFSTSVSPSLEKNDVDMLNYAKPSLDFTFESYQ